MVCAVVCKIWVDSGHFDSPGGGRRIGLSVGGLTLALAAWSGYLGWVRDDRGDFLDQKICGQID